MKELLEAARALVSDIKSTQSYARPDYFGPFSEYDTDEDLGVEIEWPNLAISLENLQKVLLKLDQPGKNGTPPFWHEQNPWKDELIYVPIEELADCALSVAHGRTKEDVLKQWSQYGIWLDAYILPAPPLTAGIRFGPEGDEYLSPGFFNSLLFLLLEKHKVKR